MEKKQHITTTPCLTPWYSWGSFFLFWLIYMAVTIPFFPNFAGSFWSFPVGIIVCGVSSFLLGMRYLWGDIALGQRGVTVSRRIGTLFLPWEDVAQVAAIRHESTRVLVLLKKGGVPFNGSHFFFFLRNPGKVVFLPDDKFTRAFLREFYSAEDIREPKDTD